MIDVNTSNKQLRFPKYDGVSLSSNSSIFLAGPTRRNSCYEDSWRYEAVKILNRLEYKGMVYVPEYPRNYEWNDDYILGQTKWEWEALENASCICFWVPRDTEEMLGLNTNIEFGRYIATRTNHIVLGHPELAFRTRYMDLTYHHFTGKDPVYTLEETMALAFGCAIKNIDSNIIL